MPHRRQRSAKYIVKSSKFLWNSHKRNLNAFYRILLILPLILTYHVVSNEMRTNKLKCTQICMMDLADLSTNPLCSLPFTNFTNPPSTSSVWIHIVLPLRSWPILLNPHHPHQTPSLSPGSTNVVVIQSQVCQGRVVLQTLCQSLTTHKDLQNTSWNHLRFFEIHIKEISAPSTAFFSYFRSYPHIMWSPMKWHEQAQIHSDLHDGLGTSQHQSSVWPSSRSFHHFTFD